MTDVLIWWYKECLSGIENIKVFFELWKVSANFAFINI